MPSTTRKLSALGGAALAASAAVIGFSGQAAHADPPFVTAYVGVGSDTTQDVLNALGGFVNGTSYTPAVSSSASGFKQIASFDAFGPGNTTGTCIATKLGGPTFARPQGSTQGRQALSKAINPAAGSDHTFSNGATCAGAPDVQGQIDFARSSSGPSGSGTDLTYIPFGRDAVSFAYVTNGGTAVTNLTTAQLTSLYTAGSANISGETVLACLPQSGSGTRSFFLGKIGVTDANATTATNPNGCTVDENNATSFAAALTTTSRAANTQLIIPFSAAGAIAQQNNASPNTFTLAASPVSIGNIDGLTPIDGTAPNLTPNSAYYTNTTAPFYGRDVYNVFKASSVPSGPGGDAGLKSLFVGAGSAVCNSTSQAIVVKFGFLQIATCGSVSLKGPLVP